MKDITIHLFEASEGGIMYDIYLGDPEEVPELEAFDGGHCTSDSLEDALGMVEQAVLNIPKEHVTS